MTTILLSLLLLFPTLAFSAEKLKVKWDCVLDRNLEMDLVGSANCIDLKQAYFKSKSIIEANEKQDLILFLRSNPLPNSIAYSVSTQYMTEEIRVWPEFIVNSSLSQGEIMEQVLLFLDSVTKPFVSIINHRDVTEAPKNEPYYGTATVNGSGSKQQGSTGLNGSGEFYGNYSTPKWRVMALGYGGYRLDKSETTEFTPGITSKIGYGGAFAGGVRDLAPMGKGRWDVALFISHKAVTNDIEIDAEDVDLPENAQHNTATKTVIKAGTEWIAVPFLTETSSGNISIRYTIGVENHKYISPESFEEMKETFAKHTLQVYLSRHFKKVDVDFSASAFRSSFRTLPVQGASASAAVKFKINSNMTVGANASLTYTQNRVMSPADGSMSFLGLTSGATPLMYNGGISFTYSLGNIRLFNKDQRWKD